MTHPADFNPLQSPGTRAGIDALNAHIKASAAAQVAYELRRGPCYGEGGALAAAAACEAPRCRAFAALRLC